MGRVKTYLRNRLLACSACYQSYVKLKYRLVSLFSLRFFFHDLKNVKRHMYWGDETSMSKEQLQAKILFFYHKIEKGLCMPGNKRLFGLDVIPKVMQLLAVWETNGNSQVDTIYLGAISSLIAYRAAIVNGKLDTTGIIIPTVDKFLEIRASFGKLQPTPIAISKKQITSVVAYEEFQQLCLMRRSFRDFSDKGVSDDVIRRAVGLAQLSPSACNRQPNRVYVVRDNDLKRQMLSHQNGNAGFGHLAPVVLAITADMSHFFDATERHQPFVDGGLFSMSLLYALQVQGLVSCCLNWCVTPTVDARQRALLSIPDSEQIIMLLVLGYPPEQNHVPLSHRKSFDHVLVFK